MKKTTGMNRAATRNWRPATRAVRAGTWRSEHGETSEAMYLTSGYTYDDAQTVADRFAGDAAGMTRISNAASKALLLIAITLTLGACAATGADDGFAN
ncbi:MAG: O-succinylhomoserine sulfhydrylase, partial [Pseudomonadota bacterium]